MGQILYTSCSNLPRCIMGCRRSPSRCVKGNAHFQENKLDPDDKKILNVSQEKLEEHFREKCAKFTQAYVNWSRSGHNDDDNFFDFCDGYKSTLLTFLMIQLELTELALFFLLRFLPTSHWIQILSMRRCFLRLRLLP